jgi:hypothetical protein
MTMKKTAILLVPALLTGCASIFEGPTNTVAISSNEPGAKYAIANRAGKTVKTGSLPARVNLKATLSRSRNPASKTPVHSWTLISAAGTSATCCSAAWSACWWSIR